jgi:hypothetical protein
MNPTAASCQRSATAAKATTNGKLGRVRFNIGTLKHASMVEYFSDNNRSR